VLARGLGPCCSSRLRTWPVIGLVAFFTQCQVSGDAKASRHDAVHEPILSPMRVAELIPIFYPPVDVDRSLPSENGICFRRTSATFGLRRTARILVFSGASMARVVNGPRLSGGKSPTSGNSRTNMADRCTTSCAGVRPKFLSCNTASGPSFGWVTRASEIGT
jgi:hypothetical protein